jgi:chemosensory pili system protein ChpC
MEAVSDDFYGLLIPLHQERLIVPRACVAEVAGFRPPTPVAGAPLWYLGTITWSGRTVPVISFETLLGGTLPTPGGRTRIVLLHCLGSDLVAGYFGVVAQGFPQLLRLTSEVVTVDATRSFPERSPVLAALRLLNEGALIPDLEYLERLIADETTAV